MPDASQFQLVAIQATSRPLSGADRQPLRNPDGSTVGASVPSGTGGLLLHWYDEALYTAWKTYARQQLNQAVRARDPVAMQNAAKAIMKANTAANIPWWIDPHARALHQVYISGMPGAPGVTTEQSAFGTGSGAIYNKTVWLAPNSNRCIVTPGLAAGQTYGGCNSDSGAGDQPSLNLINMFSGIIPAETRSTYNRIAPAHALTLSTPVQFLPRLQFVVRVPDQQSSLGAQYASYSDPHVPLPFDLALLKSSILYNDVLWKTEPKQYYMHSDGSDASSDPDGWDVWAFDRSGAAYGVPMQVRPSYEVYAVYLSAWISALESRTCAQLVQDARAYAIWRNAKSMAVSGGNLAGLAGGAIANLDALTNPSGATANGLRAAAGVVAAAAVAIGAALGTVTAGIGALVGGAVAAFAALASTVVPPDLSRVFIDDLERPKPWIERSWLSGDPSDQTQAPQLNLDAPPGWTRPRNIGSEILMAMSTPEQLVNTALANSQAMAASMPMSANFLGIPATAWWILGGLAFGGAIAYGGSRLIQGRSGSRTRSRRSSRSRRSR